ncbi:hypothetical protein M011DRAFT_273937 [Sporormia fimetaria CBS 119925]|uniref:Uncharacterized protein n=1 Tax=Sporormia fimetaria CBS 119925 TaxID=1340428 RepID=A0A6A6VHS3_9PLEO|nr:hypothetical protein M011DRAFT_273937 [Sporormia fimetaria CBS 119925]
MWNRVFAWYIIYNPVAATESHPLAAGHRITKSRGMRLSSYSVFCPPTAPKLDHVVSGLHAPIIPTPLPIRQSRCHSPFLLLSDLGRLGSSRRCNRGLARRELLCSPAFTLLVITFSVDHRAESLGHGSRISAMITSKGRGLPGFLPIIGLAIWCTIRNVHSDAEISSFG